MNIDMETRVVPLSQMKPAKYNPRKDLKPGDAEYEKIKRSLNDFGYIDPIIWNESTGNIVGGHQRYKILKAEGIEEVTCVVVHIDDPSQEKAANIALNKAQGEFDMDALKLVFEDLEKASYDLTKTAFSMDELMEIMNKESKEVKDDDFDVDEELKKPCFSRAGDVWHLGRHRVICGDSTERETFENLLGNTKVNLVCTDAPYFVALESKSGTITNDDLNDKEAYNFLMKVFSNFKWSMSSDASIYEFYATMKSRIFYDAFEDAGFRVGATLIWKKPRAPFMRTDWKFNMEPIIFGWRKDGKHIWYGDQKQTSVFEFDSIKDSATEGWSHPSSKPVPLIAYLIKQCTQTNGLVLDGFLGSASTLIACEQIDRTCFGSELEAKYVDVAVKRYIEWRGGKTDDVFVVRDGEEIPFTEAVSLINE